MMMNLWLKLMALDPETISVGTKVSDKIATWLVQVQAPVVAATALAAAIRVGYPLIFGDEQDQRAAKKRIIPMLIGVAIVVGALTWANYAKSFMEF